MSEETELFLKLSLELDKETDRALAIVSAAYLDYLLAELIAAKHQIISKTKKTELFEGPASMLHTFSSKIIFSSMSSLINGEEQHDLDNIRQIRNKFAHKFVGISFASTEIVNLCRELMLASKNGKPPLAREQYKKAAVRLMVELILKTNRFKESTK